MFQQRFMDGTPVPPEYTAKVGKLIADALETEERHCTLTLGAPGDLCRHCGAARPFAECPEQRS